MTKRENYAKIREIVKDNAELVAFIDHEVELLDKKNSTKSNKPTQKQKDNEVLKETILTAMANNKAYTVSEICELIGVDSNQKVSAMITALKNDGKVIRAYEKRVARFTKA